MPVQVDSRRLSLPLCPLPVSPPPYAKSLVPASMVGHGRDVAPLGMGGSSLSRKQHHVDAAGAVDPVRTAQQNTLGRPFPGVCWWHRTGG